MIAILVGGYVVAAALPLWGLARLVLRTQSALTEARGRSRQSGSPRVTYGEVQNQFSDRERAPSDDRNAVVWDLVLIGGGLVVGATTSIAALPGMLLG